MFSEWRYASYPPSIPLVLLLIFLSTVFSSYIFSRNFKIAASLFTDYQNLIVKTEISKEGANMKFDPKRLELLLMNPKEYFRSLSTEELLNEFEWYLEREHYYFLVERKAEADLYSMYTQLVYAFQEYAIRRDSNLQILTRVKKVLDTIDDHIQIDVKLIKEDPIARMIADGEISPYEADLIKKGKNPLQNREDDGYED
jgi:hypothetical protein